MSDQSISVVPRKSVYPNKELKAKKILEWLVSLDVVKPIPSDCILSSSDGYAISNGATHTTKEPEYLPFDLITNGLEVITERQVFHTGQHGLENLICPSCKQDIADESWEFLSEWGNNISNNLTCPVCGIATEIHQYKFTPQWGFSDLGFTFWNWAPLTEKFIDEFKQKLECEIDVVYAKI